MNYLSKNGYRNENANSNNETIEKCKTFLRGGKNNLVANEVSSSVVVSQ